LQRFFLARRYIELNHAATKRVNEGVSSRGFSYLNAATRREIFIAAKLSFNIQAESLD
jgi:hypothetical protein